MSDLNAAYRKTTIRSRIGQYVGYAALVLFLLTLVSCYKYRGVHILFDKDRDRLRPDGGFASLDSVHVRLEISDSTLSGSERLSNAWVRLSLHNDSDTDLRVPYRCMNVLPCYPFWFAGYAVGIRSVVTDSLVAVQVPMFTAGDDQCAFMFTDFFTALPAGAGLITRDSVHIFDCLKDASLVPGRYYMVGMFFNHYWQEGQPPVAVGSAVPDTLWFSVSE